MKKMYSVNFILLLAVVLLVAGATLQGQDIQWEDHFDDPENDYLLNDVGWLYFGEDDDLVGQTVMQTDDQKAFLKAGVFSSVIGAALIETNGVDYIDPTNMEDTEARIVAQSEFNDPNQIVTFNVNFKKISVFEALGARRQLKLSLESPHRVLGRREMLYLAGDEADYVCIVQSGRVKLAHQSPGGKAIICEIVGPGEVFGLEPLFGQERRESRAEAMQEAS